MNIQLVGSKVESLSLLKNDEKIDDMEFAVSNGFSKDSLSTFIIIFKLKLKIDDGYIFSVHHVSQFEASEEIKEDDRNSHFFSINAPAIAYPFLRAFVANFLLSSGFEAAMLPTINFVRLAENEDTKTKSQP